MICARDLEFQALRQGVGHSAVEGGGIFSLLKTAVVAVYSVINSFLWQLLIVLLIKEAPQKT